MFIEDVRLILDLNNSDFVSDGTPQRRGPARAARQDILASHQLVGGYNLLLHTDSQLNERYYFEARP